MNTKRSKTAAATLVVILLVLSLAVGCTFTGVDARRPATVPEYRERRSRRGPGWNGTSGRN